MWERRSDGMTFDEANARAKVILADDYTGECDLSLKAIIDEFGFDVERPNLCLVCMRNDGCACRGNHKDCRFFRPMDDSMLMLWYGKKHDEWISKDGSV